MIFRNCEDVPFVMIRNDMLQDPRLSWKSKGILAHMLSRPKDWQFYESELVRHAKDGRDAVRTGIQELIATGYIHRGSRLRDNQGKFTSYEYHVFGKPRPAVDSIQSGFSYVGESNTTKKDSTKTNKEAWTDTYGPHGERLLPGWEKAKREGVLQ